MSMPTFEYEPGLYIDHIPSWHGTVIASIDGHAISTCIWLHDRKSTLEFDSYDDWKDDGQSL